MAIHIKNRQRSKSLNLRRVEDDLAKALRLLGQRQAELSVLFVGSAKMRQLNHGYRGIPKETDVLSFPMEDAGTFNPCPDLSHPAPRLLGDIVISVPKTVAQARAYNVTFYEELLRLLIHGLLHLVGYDHEKNRYQKAKMMNKEREILHAVSRVA